MSSPAHNFYPLKPNVDARVVVTNGTVTPSDEDLKTASIELQKLIHKQVDELKRDDCFDGLASKTINQRQVIEIIKNRLLWPQEFWQKNKQGYAEVMTIVTGWKKMVEPEGKHGDDEKSGGSAGGGGGTPSHDDIIAKGTKGYEMQWQLTAIWDADAAGQDSGGRLKPAHYGFELHVDKKNVKKITGHVLLESDVGAVVKLPAVRPPLDVKMTEINNSDPVHNSTVSINQTDIGNVVLSFTKASTWDYHNPEQKIKK